MGSLCHITNPPQRDPPQTEAYTLTPNTTYGQPPQRSPAVTIYDQIQATYDVHNKQMSPPPGTQLFFASRKYDDAGCCGINLHPDKIFTHDDLEAYSPGSTTNLPPHLQQRIIDAHKNVAHIFTKPPPDPKLTWPFPYLPPNAENPDYINNFIKAIKNTPSKSRHKQFSLNIFGRLPKEWTTALIQIIQLSLATRTQPNLAHDMSRVPIPKPDTNKERRPITTAEDLACLLSAIVGASLSFNLETACKYPPYVKAYRKGISCEELTLLQLTMIEDNHQHLHNITAHLDNDEENFYDRITLEYQCACLL